MSLRFSIVRIVISVSNVSSPRIVFVIVLSCSGQLKRQHGKLENIIQFSLSCHKMKIPLDLLSLINISEAFILSNLRSRSGESIWRVISHPGWHFSSHPPSQGKRRDAICYQIVLTGRQNCHLVSIKQFCASSSSASKKSPNKNFRSQNWELDFILLSNNKLVSRIHKLVGQI